MRKKTIKNLVEKQLKWHKVEAAILWFLIAIATILTIAGVGVFFYISKLYIREQLSMIPPKSFIVSEVWMLYNFARVLGIVFSLTGIAVIIFTLDRLSFAKDAYRMASFIRKQETK